MASAPFCTWRRSHIMEPTSIESAANPRTTPKPSSIATMVATAPRSELRTGGEPDHQIHPLHLMLPVALRFGAGTVPPKKDGTTLRTSQWNWLFAGPVGMAIVAVALPVALGQVV